MSRASRRGVDSRRLGFGARLFVASFLVVVVCFLTAGVVVVVIAPGVFHHHLRLAGLDTDADVLGHVEMALRGTLLRALLPAAAVAVVVALGASWWMAHRMERSVRRLVSSAAAIAGGRYDTRVDGSGLGREFDALATAVNELARRLGETESVRRRMLADLGHEMRTPVATVDSHLEAIEDGVRAADADTLAVLRAATRRLGRLAEDIGAVSRMQEGLEAIRLEPTGARSLADAAAAIAGPSYAEADVALTVDGDDAPLRADPARIGQVLGNLLDNARRHSPAGRTVTLTTRVDVDRIVFAVADSGDGIAADRLPYVFDRFYRTDDARARGDGGSGIGLTIARALVEAHGGTLTAASDGPGTGAVFTATLPVDGTSAADANLSS
ncbi:sensor histidine kinase [Gordonia humi]|uniref:histidine kinase n=1 Tax=Gordonia humi TaxID=686429 RepID=A0A840F6D8_9ACTN|nr:HAMP domain-containing sensor histidine kinase [Gordonia humi]MBB4137109.1 signal transduction histidine kinase [Gordonia humi]